MVEIYLLIVATGLIGLFVGYLIGYIRRIQTESASKTARRH